MKRRLAVILAALAAVAITPAPAFAMHISEGILPLPWAGLWFVVALPFVIKGISEIKKSSERIAAFVPLVGMVSAAVFIVSAMPVPVPTAGTCSHPAGTGLAAILIGPFATVVAASVALLIQALFMAHGGLSTWGANLFSMGIVGTFSGYLVFKVFVKLRAPLPVAAFLAGLLSDWATYATTSFELASGLAGKASFITLFKAIFIAFIPTQLPLGILEGFAAAGFFTYVLKRRPDILTKLGIIASKPIVQEGEVYEEAAY
ncbi:MAG: energy-coupling factor ABC transporter permease [Candidatus Aquicultor sp.]